MANTKGKSSKNTVKGKDSIAALQNDVGGVSKKVSESSKAVTKAKDSGSKSGMTKGSEGSNYPQMAGFGERFLAFFIDGFIVGFAISIISNVFFASLFGGALTAFSTDVTFNVLAFVPLLVLSISLSAAVTTLYYGYFYINKNGQSLGKKVLNIKVVKSDLNSKITWGDAFLREVVGKNFLNRFVFYLGYLWYFMSPKRQTWADSIVNTYVVKADSKGNTLMGGPKEYPKKPLITFSGCGCLVLWVVVIVGVIVAAIVFGAQEFAKESLKQQNKPTNVDYRYNYQNDGSGDIDDALDEFKKVFEEEYNKSQQENSL